MGEEKFSGVVGLLGILACIGAFFLFRKIFPTLAIILLIGALLVILLLLVVVVLVIAWAFRKPEEKEGAFASGEIVSLQKEGRVALIELRQVGMRLTNQEIRKKNDEICEAANKIISEIKNHHGSLPDVRRFFNYYLPTLGKILKNYEQLERSGVIKEETTQSTINCLSDIKIAMDKQYQNLFDKYELDLTVEMEVLNMICKRDGLIADEDNEEKIILKL